jgi:hypothetical protein
MVGIMYFCMATELAAQSFHPNGLNGENPKKQNGEWVMTLRENGCNPRDYGDGRGESDCVNGNIRSQLNGTKIRPPKSVEYAFDILVPAGFTYNETLKYRPFGSIEIAGWQHTPGIKNHLYEMHLTPRKGIVFENKPCISPSEYGKWNRVKMQVRWTLKNDGFLQVFCNDRPVYALRGQNLIPPGCGTDAKSQCHTDKLQHNNPIIWQLGPWFRGFGPDWKDYGRASPFLPFPRSGVSIRVKNLYQGKIRK